MAWERTFGQMKTDLGTWLGVDTNASNPNYVRLPEDVREFLILQARRRIALRRDLRFLETTDTITTADTQYEYGLPSDWGRPYLMWYKDSSTDKVVFVKNITRSEWQAKYNEDDTSNDIPAYYTIYGGNYVFAPTPDAVYTIYMDYFSEPGDFDEDSDYDDFLIKGWDAIFFEACVDGCDFLMETSRRGIFEAKAKAGLMHLMGDQHRARYSARSLQNEIPG